MHWLFQNYMLGQMYIFKLHMKVLEKPCFPGLEMAKCFFYKKDDLLEFNTNEEFG